jgi:hypothetical protein
VVIALGADLEVLLNLFAIDDLLAVIALDPEPLGNGYLFGRRVRCNAFGSFFFKPGPGPPSTHTLITNI